jgi:ureidoacrylate peracid hydrolase
LIYFLIRDQEVEGSNPFAPTRIKIAYLKMGFLPDLSDLGEDESPNRVRHLHFGVGQPSLAPDGQHGRFLIRDTWNTDVIDELQPQPDDVVLYKHRFSGFYETELDDILHRLEIRNLIFTGCTTSVCVDSTIRDAMFRDYRCVLLADCAGEPIGSELPRSNHEASLLTIETLFGWVSDSERFVSALQAAWPVRVNALNPSRQKSGSRILPSASSATAGSTTPSSPRSHCRSLGSWSKSMVVNVLAFRRRR